MGPVVWVVFCSHSESDSHYVDNIYKTEEPAQKRLAHLMKENNDGCLNVTVQMKPLLDQ